MNKDNCVFKTKDGMCMFFKELCTDETPNVCGALMNAYKFGRKDGLKARGVGHWIIGKTAVTGISTSTCSVCGKEVTGKIGGEIKHIFMGDAVACPLCGALMMEKKDGKEETP